MKILQIILLYLGFWLINLVKYLVLFKLKTFQNRFNLDFTSDYQYVKQVYQISLIATFLNQLVLIVSICIKTKYLKTLIKICNCFIIFNIICFYLINLIVINLFRETLQKDTNDSSHSSISFIIYTIYLEEIIIFICWIIFLTWIYVQLNGRYQDVINKFGSFGIMKIIFYLNLDLQSIIFQIYICLAFGITNNSIENFYISLFLISMPLVISIVQELYVVYYIHMQIFTTFGAAKIEFFKYSQFKKLSLSILLYTIILEFLKSNTIFDLLFLFFVYGSIRLCNLRAVKRQQSSIPISSLQFRTDIMAESQPHQCNVCKKEYTHLDKIIQCENQTFHKQCKNKVQSFNEGQDIYQQINLRSIFYKTEKKIRFRSNLILISITTLDFIYYVIRSQLIQNYNLQDAILRVSQIMLYNIIIFLQDSQKKQMLRLRVNLLVLVFLSYYVHLYQLYLDISIYNETESTVFAITQNLILLIAQSMNLLMIQQVYFPIIDLKKAIILYFLRTLTINQVVYLFVYAYQIYDNYYLLASSIPALYFAFYVLNFDRLSNKDLFKKEYIKPYSYQFHQNLSQLFLIILSIYQLFSQLFPDDEYTKNDHLKVNFYIQNKCNKELELLETYILINLIKKFAIAFHFKFQTNFKFKSLSILQIIIFHRGYNYKYQQLLLSQSVQQIKRLKIDQNMEKMIIQFDNFTNLYWLLYSTPIFLYIQYQQNLIQR
ncbi:hypothetical protein pb186bvf_017819 [Paramecium bursaria]